MECLRRAIGSGYKNVPTFRTEPDLNPLRQREDFKKMMQELEAKK
jgi:hypothetical protein